jgi:catechol 2,3-dioxygenase-like lactoylglutathione lyase family enzyme
MVTIVALDHVQVAAPPGCEADARRFYGGLLGLVEVPNPATLAGRGGAWFALGSGQQLHVGVDAEFAPARNAHPALRVADGTLEALAERLLRAGCDVRWDDGRLGVARFHVEDPWGNRLELLAPLPMELLVAKRRHDATIVLADYDPAWPERFAVEAGEA